MAKITDLVAEIARPVVAAAGCALWDVEYVKQAGQWFLRVYIDKEQGVSIDDCEAVSRPLSDLLDEVDPIQDSYTFEVSSAGIDRALTKPAHFLQLLGAQVEVKLYQPKSGRKEHVGVLLEWKDGDLTLEIDGASVDFTKQEIAQVRLYPHF
jgi:ribosome maturation factor RimP